MRARPIACSIAPRSSSITFRPDSIVTSLRGRSPVVLVEADTSDPMAVAAAPSSVLNHPVPRHSPDLPGAQAHAMLPGSSCACIAVTTRRT